MKKTNLTGRPIVNNRALLQHFNLSRNKSLRTLETTAESIDAADGATFDFFETVLPSITSSAPLDVVVIYEEFDFSIMPHCSWCDSEAVRSCCNWPIPRVSEDVRCQRQFRAFREMHRVRAFRLVLCVDVFDCMVEGGIEALRRFVEAEKVKGGLDYLSQEPLIIFEKRSLRTRFVDQSPGWSMTRAIHASAL